MEVNISLADLGYLINKSHDELQTTLLNEEGQQIENLGEKLKSLHDENLSRFKDERTRVFNDGYKKAQKEVLEKKEAEFRSKFNVEGATIDDIVGNVFESGKSEAKVNPNDVKNSEIYLNDIQKFKKRVEELEKNLDEERKGREYDKVSSKLDSFIPAALKGANKVLPEEGVNEHIELLKLRLKSKGIYFALNDEGKPIPVDEEGNRLRNDNTLKDYTAEEIVEQHAFFLPTAQNSGAQSPGNANNQNGGKSFSYGHVKNADDYLKEIDNIMQIEDEAERTARQEALEAHGASQGL